MTFLQVDETLKIKIKQTLSRVQLFVTPWTVAHQAPLSVEFSRQESWSRLPFPSPGDLPDQGLNPGILHCRQILYHLSHQGSLYEWEYKYIFSMCTVVIKKKKEENFCQLRSLFQREYISFWKLVTLIRNQDAINFILP